MAVVFLYGAVEDGAGCLCKIQNKPVLGFLASNLRKNPVPCKFSRLHEPAGTVEIHRAYTVVLYTVADGSLQQRCSRKGPVKII